MKKFITLIAFGLIIFIGRSVHHPAQAKTPTAVGFYVNYLPLVAKPIPPAWIGPDGGKIVSMAVDPTHPDTVYAGTWGAGVFKTITGGEQWYAINTGLNNSFIWSLAVNPLQSNIVYAGTNRDKLYKSINGGASWFSSSNGIQDGAIVYDILIDPTNPDRVYIATRGISVKLDDGTTRWNGIVYRSLDGGASWKTVLSDIPSLYQQDWAYGLAINPTSPKNIYAAMHQSGIYHSDDYGISWYSANDGIPIEVGDIRNTRDILIDSSRSPYYAYTGLWHEGVFKSTDSINSWIPTNNGIAGVKIYRMTLDPNQPNTIYLSTQNNQGIIKSTNGGDTWSPSGLPTQIIWDVLVNPQNSQVLYTGTDADGVYKSTNAGLSWFHAQRGLWNASTTGTVTLSGDPKTLYVSTMGGGVYKTTDSGATWNEYNLNLGDLSIHALIQHPTNPNLVYALSNASGLFSTDISLGKGWTASNGGLPVTSSPVSAFEKTHPFAGAPIPDQDVIDAALKPETRVASTTYNPLLSISFAPSNPNIAYLGTSGAGVYKSLNGTVAWASAGLTGQSIWSLAVDPTNPAKVYAAVNVAGGVKVSQDGGSVWQDLSIGTLEVYALAFSSSAPASLYAGTSGGLYQWVDGPGWVYRGLAGVKVTTLAARSISPNFLYVGTEQGTYTFVEGSGVWMNGPAELSNHTIQAINFDLNEPLKGYFSTNTQGILLAQIAR
jgi:photosystem II stability/assembly factor-like uncharacterized protein